MYVILWEFVVPPEKVDAFLSAYKDDGTWAKLFAQAEGYVGTELLSSADGARYITIDRWQHAEDFTRFQEQFGDEYKALDTELEGLTVRERKLGMFVSAVRATRPIGELEMFDEVEFLKHIYERFNARDIETVLAALHEDVVWANGMEGGHEHGRDAVRGYWTRQWAMVDPHVEPVGFSNGPEGETVVEVHQVVHDLNGALLLDQMVGHIFRIEDGLVRRFDIRGA